jgi:hypothetical protein
MVTVVDKVGGVSAKTEPHTSRRFQTTVILFGIFRAGTDEYELCPDSRSNVEKRYANRQLDPTFT